jgi:hypothetical protein
MGAELRGFWAGGECLLCVVSCQGLDQGPMSPLLPKGVIRSTLGSLQAFLKCASCDHSSYLNFIAKLVQRADRYRSLKAVNSAKRFVIETTRIFLGLIFS